jgi:hypothetical protein
VEAPPRAIVGHRKFGRIYRRTASSVVRAVRGLRHPEPSVPAQASGKTGLKFPVVRMKEHDA